jgi:hypothetical protein
MLPTQVLLQFNQEEHSPQHIQMTTVGRANKGLNSLVLQGFKKAVTDVSLHGRWWSDKALLLCLVDCFELQGVLNEDIKIALRQMNKAIGMAAEFDAIDMHFPRNQIGVFRMKFFIAEAKTNHFFYYFDTKDKTKGPNPLTNKTAQKVFINLMRKKRQLNDKHDGENKIQRLDNSIKTDDDNNDEEESTNKLPSVHDEVLPAEISLSTMLPESALLSQTLSYWNSKKASQLFGTKEGESVILSVCEMVDICQHKAMQNVGSIVFIKYLLLKKAYEIALCQMPSITMKFMDCCQHAIEILKEAGLDTVNNPVSLLRWNRYFRVNFFLEMDPEHKTAKAYEPMLFVCYPECKEIINRHYSNKLECLSVESFRSFFLDELIPNVVEMENENNVDDVTTKEIVMGAIGLSSLSLSTTHKYLNYLGYKYSDQKKSYYNDGHEKAENVAYRINFINKMFSIEVSQYLWISMSESDAIIVERDIPMLKNIFYPFMKDGIAMREYHVDTHPSYLNYIHPHNASLGGNLSVRNSNTRPLIVIGQDESAFSQYMFSSKSWKGPEGQSQLLPKSEGETIMVSCFQSRVFGLSRLLTTEELVSINMFRRQRRPKYFAAESAINVIGVADKKPLENNSPFERYFDVGIDKDGYWNYHHMALQFEDVVDCLQVLYPEHDLCFIFDQSSGHAKKRVDGLNVNGMNLNWGGNQKRMRETVLDENCLGTYQRKYNPDDTQSLIFCEQDDGPFKMNAIERERRRYDQVKERVRRNKTKRELIDNLMATNQFKPIKYYTLEELQRIANNLNVSLDHEADVIIEGWVKKPKGILQVLYERGFIDRNRPLSDYSLDGKVEWKDEFGEIFPRYLPLCLRYLLSECSDFKNEVSALEDLASKLTINESEVSIIYSPKYHCEIAGDGIEYSWGLSKKYYRNLPLQSKKGLANFRESVIDSVRRVTVDSARKFSALARRYMLAYSFYDTRIDEENNQLAESGMPSYTDIERFVKKEAKVHRSVSDIDSSNITKVWRSSLCLPNL